MNLFLIFFKSECLNCYRIGLFGVFFVDLFEFIFVEFERIVVLICVINEGLIWINLIIDFVNIFFFEELFVDFLFYDF